MFIVIHRFNHVSTEDEAKGAPKGRLNAPLNAKAPEAPKPPMNCDENILVMSTQGIALMSIAPLEFELFDRLEEFELFDRLEKFEILGRLGAKLVELDAVLLGMDAIET